MSFTYLSTSELSARMKYNDRTIREEMVDSVLLEGRHYLRPFGGRKLLFIWENIEEDMYSKSRSSKEPLTPTIKAGSKPNRPGANHASLAIPMANGGTFNG